MDLTATRTKLMGFGMQLLDNIDPNPDNFVCAGIVHTSTQQIGCLLRLEPNKPAQVKTIIAIAKSVTNLLRNVFYCMSIFTEKLGKNQ